MEKLIPLMGIVKYLKIRNCVVCGEEIVVNRTTHNYCSMRCRQKVYMQTEKAKARRREYIKMWRKARASSRQSQSPEQPLPQTPTVDSQSPASA